MDAKLNSAGWISEQMGGLRLVYFQYFHLFFHFGLFWCYAVDVHAPFGHLTLYMVMELFLGFVIWSGNSSDGFQ